MRKAISRALPGLGLAGALCALGALLAVPAGASTYPAIFTASQAGILDGNSGGWHFRYLAATLTVPPCTNGSGPSGVVSTGIALQSGKELASIDIIGCGSTPHVAFDSEIGCIGPDCTPNIGPLAAGDKIAASIYYHLLDPGRPGYQDAQLTVTNDANDMTGGAPIYFPGALFSLAWLRVGLDNAKITTSPPTSVKLSAFTNCHVTSYNGTRGTGLAGRWPTHELWDIAPSGAVVANLGRLGLWDSSQNFTVYERPTA